MNIKELEKEVEKLKKEIEKIKGKKNFCTFRDIAIGEQFKYHNLVFTKLSEDLSLLDSIDPKWSFSIFDGESNDYEKSVLREYINKIFLDKIGVDKDDFVPFENGDIARPLSLKEAKEHKHSISEIEHASWLRSGHSYGAGGAYYLLPYGAYNYGYYGSVNYSFAVRPSFIFQSAAKVEYVEEE